MRRREAILRKGAEVRVRIYQDANAFSRIYSDFHVQNELDERFGLDASAGIVLTVRWPSGSRRFVEGTSL